MPSASWSGQADLAAENDFVAACLFAPLAGCTR
jgi:hypothetical protein